MTKAPVKRCAIYTRKSHEEGLEQEFNTLHAQREASEAFIISQKHEGWQVIKAIYDDGGFSGGNMERPALKQLLADITAGKIDVIVVYKVDRLSRSLHDFAKMVEVFDKHNVSFVSVTQQFNTTSSMGRLTLNVLLSFTQFEREVTGERIRDKIAASKKKGMWMGGTVPIGYEVRERKLIIIKSEADTVRHIYRRYVELGSVRLLKIELDNHGIRTKTRTKANGRTVAGCSFSRGSLYNILANPLYIGQIRHKGICHDGMHDPIIDSVLWKQVQQRLKVNSVDRSKGNKTEPSLLLGKLFDEAGQGLTPSHAVKKGRRYRYYISKHLTAGKTDKHKTGWRLPAHEIEQAIVHAAKGMLKDRDSIITSFTDAGIAAHHIPAVLTAAADICKQANADHAILQMIERVELKQDGIRLKLSLVSLVPVPAMDSASSSPVVTQDIPMKMKRRGIEMRLVIGDATASKADPALVKTIARARSWFDDLVSGRSLDYNDIAVRNNVSSRYVGALLPLAFLAPDIVTAIIEGNHPVDLTAEKLTKQIKLPLDWAEQRRLLGFH